MNVASRSIHLGRVSGSEMADRGCSACWSVFFGDAASTGGDTLDFHWIADCSATVVLLQTFNAAKDDLYTEPGTPVSPWLKSWWFACRHGDCQPRSRVRTRSGLVKNPLPKSAL